MSDAFGTTPGVELRRGDGGSPETFLLIGEVFDIQQSGATRPEINVSHFGSTSFETLLGLRRHGQYDVQGNLIPGDSGQVLMRDTDTGEDTPRNWRIVLPANPVATITFSALVEAFNISLAQDDAGRFNGILKLSGTPVWT